MAHQGQSLCVEPERVLRGKRLAEKVAYSFHCKAVTFADACFVTMTIAPAKQGRANVVGAINQKNIFPLLSRPAILS